MRVRLPTQNLKEEELEMIARWITQHKCKPGKRATRAQVDLFFAEVLEEGYRRLGESDFFDDGRLEP